MRRTTQLVLGEKRLNPGGIEVYAEVFLGKIAETERCRCR
jgi:hypothetical protein